MTPTSPSSRARKTSSKHPSPTPAPVVLPAMSKDEINALPVRAWEGPVLLVQDEETLNAALSSLDRQKVLGFDTETRPTFTKGKSAPPALIQLATSETVYLIQLTHVPFNERLAELLASPSVLKVGVAIGDDMKALGRVHSFRPGGMVDLAAMARARGVQAQGLRTLAASLLGFRISKAAQCSNWENPELTRQQIKYAATDAWVGREIYLHLLKTAIPA
ncbi:3'-5' exonuclease [uncultured Mailhella sp.]|uniref:3'-5' exonuclease n=1 Tax=uncultured Mailhella sp. TaxID=1981031 RepID=UPI00344CBF30